MDNVTYTILNLLAATLLLTACNPQPEAPALLRQAQVLIDVHPDSAMCLIDSIFYPEESLKRRQYMQYLVTRVQARYKNFKPIHEDTLIFKAKDYFLKRKDVKEALIACFYSGCVYREQQKLTEAMQCYKKAEEYVLEIHDANLKGLIQYNIADLLAEQDLYAEARESYKLAEKRYAQSPEKPAEKQAKCLSDA